MAYEIITKNSRGNDVGSAVSIGSGGIVYLNATAMRDHFKGIEHVHLLFDAEHRKAAIKPLKGKEANSFKLNFSSQARKSTGMFTARSFSKKLGFDKTVLKSIPAVWNEKNKFLEFDLKK